MIILRQKRVIRIVIWVIAIAFILSIPLIAGVSYFSKKEDKKQIAERQARFEKLRRQAEAEEAERRATVLATYAGGEVTLGEVIDLYEKRLDPEIKRYFQGNGFR